MPRIPDLNAIRDWCKERFITNLVDNLVNYYKKSETYTKEEITDMFDNLSQSSMDRKVGDIDSLETKDKESLVGAINEVITDFDDLAGISCLGEKAFTLWVNGKNAEIIDGFDILNYGLTIEGNFYRSNGRANGPFIRNETGYSVTFYVICKTTPGAYIQYGRGNNQGSLPTYQSTGANRISYSIMQVSNNDEEAWRMFNYTVNNNETFFFGCSEGCLIKWIGAEIDKYVKKSGDTVSGTLIMQGVTLNDGVHNREVMKIYDDGDGDINYGSELSIGAGGNVFIGSGESYSLRSDFQTNGVKTGENYSKAGEQLYLTSDNIVYIYSNGQEIGNRKGIALDTTGSLRPLTSGGASLGSSSTPWGNIYGNGNNIKNTFSAAASRTNLTSGEALNVSLGKIQKYFNDLGYGLAFSKSYSNLTNVPLKFIWNSNIDAYLSEEVDYVNCGNAIFSGLPNKAYLIMGVGSASSSSNTAKVDYIRVAIAIWGWHDYNSGAGEGFRILQLGASGETARFTTSAQRGTTSEAADSYICIKVPKGSCADVSVLEFAFKNP